MNNIITIGNQILHLYNRLLPRCGNIESILQRMEELIPCKETDENGKRVLHTEQSLLERIDALYRLPSRVSTNTTVLYANETRIGILGKCIVKPSVFSITVDELECNNKLNNKQLNKEYEKVTNKMADYTHHLRNVVWIEDTPGLQAFEAVYSASHTRWFIHAYVHAYRTYTPFTCTLLLQTESTSFFVCMLKRKQLVTHLLNFVNRQQKRVCITTRTCEQLWREYGMKIDGLTVHGREKYVVDYRIDNLETEWYRLVSDDTDYSNDYSSDSNNLMNSFIKLRDFIAQTNNESVNYILTNNQLNKLMECRPKSKEEINGMMRCSALFRAHMEDFLFLLRNE